MSAVVVHLSGDDVLLLLPVPFLLVCAVFMTVGLFEVRGGFKLVLTKGWVVVVLPTLLAGLWGIARAVAS